MLERIIKLLHENARLSEEEIAQRVGAKPEEVARLLEEAESGGLIKGYRVITADEAQPDDRVVGMVEVGLSPERDRGFDRIAERIARFPEVLSCTLMSGTYDLLVTVNGSDLRSVAAFVSERLATIEGVRSTRTHFVLKRYKEDGVLLFKDSVPERLPISP
ncbi:Lrp/AsnC family transcriptional regulator [bacterium]|nr:Lrp/AsnC family transcriptional regulator [bacterium]